MFARISCLFAALAVASPTPAWAQWPEFRGPGRSGVAVTGDFPVHFGPTNHVAWSAPVAGGHSSPVVWGGQVFLTGYDGQKLLVLSLDLETGTNRWRRTLEPGPIEGGSRLSHPATATPATDGAVLVTYFAPFGLAAWDLAGRELWRHPLPTPITQHGASSSPVIAGDLVIQLCDQDVGSYLLALDLQTGQPRWRAERPAVRRGFSTPLPWPTAAPDIVVVAGTLRLVAYDLLRGTERWSVAGLPNEMVASPVPGDGRIHVAGWTPGSGVPRMPDWAGLLAKGDTDQDSRLSRAETPAGPARQHFHYFDADRDEFLSREEYESLARIFNEAKNAVLAVRPGGAGDVTTTHVEWQRTRGLPYVPSPLVYEGRLYLVKNGGLVSCLDARTGEFRYQEERLGALGDYYSSPVAADGKVLAISQPGTAVVFRAGDTLEILARNPLGGPVLATPAIAGDRLLVRTDTRLFAFRETPPAPPAPPARASGP